jgi:ADP-ribosylglycohydrolase
MNIAREQATRQSALWAAFGDALGFISELTDERGLLWRTGTKRVENTKEWRRNIGGRFGVEVVLPAGSYSDDTQLRLATSRAIRGDGNFDVESFAKIELVIWPAYALGGGRSSRAAATHLSRTDVNWFSNFFETSSASYLQSGGNGAAMRIQPHVWSARNLDDETDFVLDVLRNALCSHGHPRGIGGAVFHALCLATALRDKRVPGPPDWMEMVAYFPKLVRAANEEDSLRSFWLPVWEERSNSSFEDCLLQASAEMRADIQLLSDFENEPSEAVYDSIVRALGADREEQKGSGLKTALIAAMAAWMFRKKEPLDAVVAAANMLLSDTDTIATMAGAILGCIAKGEPPGPIKDKPYLEREAHRLYLISQGEQAETFEYPDLFAWTPPRAQVDVVTQVKDSFWIQGLGDAKPVGELLENRRKDGSAWQWFELTFGQTVLAKRRLRPQRRETEGGEEPKVGYKRLKSRRKEIMPTLPGLALEHAFERESTTTQRSTVDELTKDAIASNFDPRLIGEHLLSFASYPDGIERAIAYTAILLKAKLSRQKADARKVG